MSITPKASRLEVRVHPDVKEYVKSAAAISGVTLSRFIIEAVTAKAQRVMDNESRIMLAMEGAESVFKTLDRPPQINDKLRNAAKRLKSK